MNESLSRLRRTWRRTLTLGAAVLALGATELVVTAAPAAAATSTYYVDCSASDNGVGTQASPWNNTSSVNAVTFEPGDSVLFKRGTTCSGYLAPQGSGSSGATVTVDAYGTGARPVIAAASTADAAFKLSDQSYWDVQNLEITGGVSYGVLVTGVTDNSTLTHIHLTNLDVHGATGTTTTRGDSGEVYVYPTGSEQVINDVVIDGVTAHDSTVSQGIFVGGAYGAFPPGTVVPTPGNTPIGQDITISNSTAYNIAGDGILLTMAENGTIEHSVAYDSGSCSSCTSTPSGLWEWYCQTCMLQFNEAYDNHTYNKNDGAAFDIDQYNADNTLQYNYGHDNDGYCVALYNASDYKNKNNIFRYNVCANNVRKSTSRWGEVQITQGSQNMQIYNNTFYSNPANTTQFLGVEASTTGFFKNNIVYSTATNLLSYNSGSKLVMDDNLYYVTTGATPTFTSSGTAYSGLSAFQSGTGQDAHSTVADPLLNSPTYHDVGTSLTAGTLQSGSPAYGMGVNVCQGIPGCSMGSTDYFGNAVTTAGVHNAGAFDVPAPLSSPKNTGFESGSCSSWSCYGGTSVVTGNARSGTYAARLPGGVSAGAQQTVSGLTPNTTYTLRGFGKSGVAGQCVYVGAKAYDSSGGETKTCLSSTSYTGGSVTFTTGASSTSALVYFWSPSSNSGTGYGDDLALSVVPAAHSYGALQNTASSSCADVPGSTHTAATKIDLYTCNGGANQQWTKGTDGSLKVYATSTMCLDVLNSATSSGSSVVINSCSGGTSQQWTANTDGTITGVASGLCLGTAGAATANGTVLQIQTCSGANSQKWTML